MSADSQQPKMKPRPSSAAGQLLEQAQLRIEAARAAGRWWLALKHEAIKRQLEKLVFGDSDD